MRLGDLDALKEDFNTRLEKAKRWEENAINRKDYEIAIRAKATSDFICEVIMSIDNAPTIKTFTLLDIEEQYRKGLEKGLSEWETERPQGEWKHHEEYTNNRTFYITECPFCKLRVQEETNFCPNCGADMRGGEE